MNPMMTVRRDDLRQVDWVSRPAAEPGPGQVALRIDAFALTANNITYGAFGDAMRYWDFFPTGDAATGCIPVWGFADVTASRCDGIAPGERFYGYWPIAGEVVLTPSRVGDTGFVDGSPHRQELAAIYNHYLRTRTDPLADPALEAQQALLRPLFTTSFLIDDFLADERGFGATTVLLSSASSKTAYGTAFCLARRRGGADAMRVIGLTSAAHRAFAEALGCYDAVRDYADGVADLPDQALVYVDFSGHAELRATIHRELGTRLVHSAAVGGTHWEHLGGGQGLPGPRPVLFFAPARARQRIADWGADGFQARLAAAWSAFMQAVARADDPWLQVVRRHGPAAVQACYLDLLGGRSDPRQGHYLSV